MAKTFKVKIRGKELIVRQLPNGKFEIPAISQFVDVGLGSVWFDDGRIPYEADCRLEKGGSYRGNRRGANKQSHFNQGTEIDYDYKLPQGRFPANLLASDDALNDGRVIKAVGGIYQRKESQKKSEIFNQLGDAKYLYGKGNISPGDSGSFSRYFSLDAWFAKKLTELPKSVQKTFPFLIIPKASKAEKNRGCEELRTQGRGIAMRSHNPEPYEIRQYSPCSEIIAKYLKKWRKKQNLSKREMDEKLGIVTLYSWFEGRPKGIQLPTPSMWWKLKSILKFDDKHDREMTTTIMQEKQGFENSQPTHNHHPTCKPIKLMSYLITLGSRPDDVVLDPFVGSGTTAIAAKMLRRHYIGFETDPDYCRIAEARLSAIQEQLI